MTLKRQVYLTLSKEPLQINYPAGFKGAKSVDIDDPGFHISTHPRFLTDDEIEIAQSYILKLPYRQILGFTGCVLISPNDPLLQFDQARLDKLEQDNKLPNSRYAATGGERSLKERVLLIRENGYTGTGSKSLVSSK